ncbi:MAG: hypothetical protein L6Q92_02050 [Phycisphaerae bacterium]|nr:hypothetical protein [Phycisphaerae bacterium]
MLPRTMRCIGSALALIALHGTVSTAALRSIAPDTPIRACACCENTARCNCCCADRRAPEHPIRDRALVACDCDELPTIPPPTPRDRFAQSRAGLAADGLGTVPHRISDANASIESVRARAQAPPDPRRPTDTTVLLN